MKKAFVAAILLCIILAGALFVYHSFGWFRGDTLEYIKMNYLPDGNEIVSGEYLAIGEDEESGYIIYQVVTEADTSHFIRVNVVFHRYLTKIGPDFKIQDIREIPYYEEETMKR